MALFESEICFTSTGRTYARDITPVVNELIEETETDAGLITLSSLHTTLGFTINEGMEPNLLLDLIDMTQWTIPEDIDGNWAKGKSFPQYPYPTKTYRHYCGDNPMLKEGEKDDERNAPRHGRMIAFADHTLLRPYRERKLLLGRFQRLLVLEFDGRDGSDGNPIRERKIHVEINSYEDTIKKLSRKKLPDNAKF